MAGDELEGVKYSSNEATTWEAQLESALKFRAKFGREDRWKRYTKRLAHIYHDGRVSEESPVVNIMAARIRSLVPQLAIGMPSAKVTSLTRPLDPNSEPALSAMLESRWAMERMDEETRRVTLDAETYGIGVGFVGYETSWGTQVVGRQRRAFGVLPPDVTDKMSKATGGATDAISTEEDVTVPDLLSERWFLERVSPFNLVLDPTADHITNANYMGRRLFLSEKDAKEWFGKKCPKADSVGNVTRWETSETNPFSANEPPDMQDVIDTRVRRVVVWEIWDIVAGRTVYLNRSGKVFFVREWASTYAGFPFAYMLWDEIPDSVFPEGMAAALEPLANELHVIRKRELQALRTGIRKYVSRGPLSQKARQALLSARDGEVVELSDYDSLEALQFQPIPPDMYSIENRVKSDMDEVSATSPNLALSQGSIRKTATESAFIQSAADAMIGYRQLMVERFASRVLEIGLSITTQLFDTPIPLKVINADPSLTDFETGERVPLGDTVEYTFIGVDHAGHYRVDVEPGSMVAAARDVENQQYQGLWDCLKDEEWFDRKAFGIHMLSRQQGIRDAGNFVLKEQPPEVQAEQASAAPPVTPGVLAGLGGGAGQAAAPPQQPGSGDLGLVNPTAEGDMMSAVLGANAPQMRTG